MNRFLLSSVIFTLGLIGCAHAQSSPKFSYGQVPTAAQYNAAFASKQDRLQFTPLNRAGDTLTGRLQTAPATINGSGLAILPGLTPTQPNNGDIWATDAGFFARVANTTFKFGSQADIAAEATRAQNVEATKAPIASPTFTGIVTAPSLVLSGSASTGDVSGMSVMPQGATATNTLKALLGRVVYITDFMSLGSTDITAALGAAETKLGAMGGQIVFPATAAGYTITASHLVPSNVVYVGDGIHSSIITSNFDGDALQFGDGVTTNQNGGVRNIVFRSSITRTQGAMVALRGTFNFKGKGITCDVSPYVCVDVHGGPNSFKIHLDDVYADGSPYVGIRVGFAVGQAADVWIRNPLVAGASRAAIELINASGVQISGGDYISNAMAWLFDPGDGQSVFGLQTTGGYLDTSTGPGLKMAPTGSGKITDGTLTGLWASTSGQTNGAPGVLVQGTAASVRSVAFNGLRAFNNGGEGFRNEGSAYVDLNDPQIGFNSVYSAGTYSGIFVGAGVSNWSVVGGRSGAGTQFAGGNPQKYGLEIATGAGDAISVVGVDLTGNMTGSLSNGATGANQTIIAQGAPYGLTGGKFGIGTMTPNNSLTAVGASRALADAGSGGALAQFSTGTGANTDNALLFGVQDATLAWLQAIKAGSQTLRLHLNGIGGAVALGAASPAVTEVKNFPYIPAMAGAPTGMPNAITGMAPFVVDTTNSKLCAYVNTAWKCATLQ